MAVFMIVCCLALEIRLSKRQLLTILPIQGPILYTRTIGFTTDGISKACFSIKCTIGSLHITSSRLYCTPMKFTVLYCGSIRHLGELMQPTHIAYLIFVVSSRSIREITICADQYWKDKNVKKPRL